MRVAQHLDQVGVDVFDLGGVGVEQQNPVSRGFKKSAVAAFGYPKRVAGGSGSASGGDAIAAGGERFMQGVYRVAASV